MKSINYLQLITLILLALISNNYSYAQGWQQLNDSPFYKHHSNSFGYNGKAYILEGVGFEAVSNELWEYSPDTDSWVRLPNFPGPSRAIAIGDDWNGKYYYGFGEGTSGPLNDLWEFNPVDTSWIQLPSCPCVGRRHPALAAHNDKILMGTGSSANGDLDDWWEYDMITQEWTQKQDIPGGNRHHPFQFGIDNYVYVGGGHRSNWVQYNIETEEIKPIDATPGGRVAGSQFSYNGWGFLLGGDTFVHAHVPDNETFMAYDPQTEEWEYLPPLPKRSRWAPSSFIIDDILYFFGGLSDNYTNDATMWKFDLTLLDCLPPNDLSVVELSDVSARLMWSSSSEGIADTLRWKKVGESWNIVANVEPVFELDNLEACQEYEFQISTQCSDLASYSESIFFYTKGCGSCVGDELCPPYNGGASADLAFINEVQINSYINTSGNNNGYEKFIVPDSEEIVAGESFSLTIEPGAESDTPTANLAVWIDFNGNGVYNSNEKVVSEINLQTTLTQDIQIPNSATTGLVSMRIMYFNQALNNSCYLSGSNLSGEAEDYCINISEVVGLTDTDNYLNKITVFPNPFQNTVQLKGEFPANKKYHAKIIDVTGKVVKSIGNFYPNDEIDLSSITQGIYFLKLEDESSSISIKIVK